jgi:hypothetical protein
MVKRKRSDASDGDAPGAQLLSGVLRRRGSFRQADGLAGGDVTPDGDRVPFGPPNAAWRHPDDPNKALHPDENAAVDKFLDDARKTEERTTPSILKAIDENGGRAIGLDYRLKGEDSLKLKVANALDMDDERDIDRALKGVNDSVRYTAEFDSKRYTKGVDNVHDSLRRDGFEPNGDRGRYNWDPGPGYKGINSTWRDPQTGTQVEVQYHTADSFKAKQVTHDLYDQMKLEKYGSEKWQELADKQGEVFGSVPIPDGVESLRWMDGKR